MIKTDIDVMAEMSPSAIAKALDKFLGIDLTREEVQLILDKEYNDYKNYISIASVPRFELSLTELQQLTEMDYEKVDCLEDLRLSYLKDDYVKKLSVFLRDSKYGDNIIQRNHKLDVLRRKLEKVYDEKYGKNFSRKGYRKLLVKAALISLVKNQNLM